MEQEKIQEILSDIINARFGAGVAQSFLQAGPPTQHGWEQGLSSDIKRELGVNVTPQETAACASLAQLSMLVELRAEKNAEAQTIIQIYDALEKLAREELHTRIHYRWNARWADFAKTGNWLTSPDGLDYVELTMRIEEEFGFGIPDRDTKELETVGQTVRYIWRRGCTQAFVLRPLGGASVTLLLSFMKFADC